MWLWSSATEYEIMKISIEHVLRLNFYKIQFRCDASWWTLSMHSKSSNGKKLIREKDSLYRIGDCARCSVSINAIINYLFCGFCSLPNDWWCFVGGILFAGWSDDLSSGIYLLRNELVSRKKGVNFFIRFYREIHHRPAGNIQYTYRRSGSQSCSPASDSMNRIFYRNNDDDFNASDHLAEIVVVPASVCEHPKQ